MNNDLISRSALLIGLDNCISRMRIRAGRDRLKNAAIDLVQTARDYAANIPAVDAVHWISVKERLPEQSCQVVAMTLFFDGDKEQVSSIMNMAYSAKWKAFNTYDYPNEAEARKTEIHPAFWMPMPDVPEEGC